MAAMLRSSLLRQLAVRGRSSAAAAQGWATAGATPAAAAAAAAVGALHTCAPLLASLQVKIPALGESISDGTVAAVLKKAGDRVEEDEPILQIETDKVTVDVRSPKAGIIEAILVKTDDNVEVGHVVASIADATGAKAGKPARQQQQQAAAPPPPQPKQAPAPAPEPVAPSAPDAPAHRTPAIRFPPRRTPDGKVLSSLDPSTAKQLLSSMLGDVSSAQRAAPTKPPPIPAEYAHMIAVPIVGGSSPILRGMPVPSGPTGPPRRTISDTELEAIMLGGADP